LADEIDYVTVMAQVPAVFLGCPVVQDNEPPNNPSLISLKGVGKSYSGVWVLKDASFSVLRGEIVALVGENGAGKSTLKNILCGLVAPDVGSLAVAGKDYPRLTTQDASLIGIAAIHQELSLFPNLSIAENVHMGVGRLPSRFGLVDRAAMADETLRLLSDFFETPLDPNLPVERLSLGERQMVEVAKALHRASTMLILDEPTTSLSLPERRRLFDVARRLRQRGYALIYITHFMEEIYELADRIVVLRDGRVVGTGTPRQISQTQLTSLMAGRELAEIDADLASEQRAAASRAAAAAVRMRVRDLSDSGLLRGVTFELHAGEILGLGGLMGAGRSEVAEAIFGIHPADGAIEIDGQLFDHRTPATAQARGLALVSEDRRADQIFAGRSVRENLTSTILDSLTQAAGYLSSARQQDRAMAMTREYGIRHPGLEAPMIALSGGNQQKCVIARWLAGQPAIIILDEPTKGIDVGAKAEIHRLISRLAAAGRSVLLISSDLPELLALSHRILVMHKGRIVGGLKREQFDPATIVHMASTGTAA
jgi:inositol transport system ATP-binding protein